MVFFWTHRKSELGLLESRFSNVMIWHKGRIKKNYDRRLPDLIKTLKEIVSQSPGVDFLILFDEREKRRSWCANFYVRVVVNVAFNPSGLEFKQELQKAIEGFKLFESSSRS